jgi:hypothetical protein
MMARSDRDVRDAGGEIGEGGGDGGLIQRVKPAQANVQRCRAIIVARALG